MPDPRRIYYINLCYEAYYIKAMELPAGSLSEACEFAMVHADDGPDWTDTLESSGHWIESVNHSMALVPEEYSAEAIRLAGAELAARRLHQALRSLVDTCDRHVKTSGEVRAEVGRAKAVLSEGPVSYFQPLRQAVGN